MSPRRARAAAAGRRVLTPATRASALWAGLQGNQHQLLVYATSAKRAVQDGAPFTVGRERGMDITLPAGEFPVASIGAYIHKGWLYDTACADYLQAAVYRCNGSATTDGLAAATSEARKNGALRLSGHALFDEA